jgi:hypothetical protein
VRTVGWIFVLAAAGCATHRHEAAAELRRAKAEARAVGALMTLEEMREATAVPPEENAWPHYEKAHAALVDPGDLVSATDEVTQGKPERMLRFWARETEAIGYLREALKRPKCDPGGLSDPLKGQRSRAPTRLNLWIRVLCGRAFVAAVGGPEEVVQSLRDVRTIQLHTMHVPDTIAVLVVQAGGSMAIQSAVQIAEERPDDTALLNGLRSELAAHERMRFPLRRAFRFDSSMTALLFLYGLDTTLQPKVGQSPAESPI